VPIAEGACVHHMALLAVALGVGLLMSGSEDQGGQVDLFVMV
jgi:hypothetical protein